MLAIFSLAVNLNEYLITLRNIRKLRATFRHFHDFTHYSESSVTEMCARARARAAATGPSISFGAPCVGGVAASNATAFCSSQDANLFLSLGCLLAVGYIWVF